MRAFFRKRTIERALRLGDELGVNIRKVLSEMPRKDRETAYEFINRLFANGCNEKDIFVFLMARFIRTLPEQKIPYLNNKATEWAGQKSIRESIAEDWHEAKRRYEEERETERIRRLENAREHKEFVSNLLKENLPDAEVLSDKYVLGYIAGIVHVVGHQHGLDDGAYSVLTRDILVEVCEGEELVADHMERLRQSIENEEVRAFEGFENGVEDGMNVLEGNGDLSHLNAYLDDRRDA